jgi:hypothetical protein
MKSVVVMPDGYQVEEVRPEVQDQIAQRKRETEEKWGHEERREHKPHRGTRGGALEQLKKQRQRERSRSGHRDRSRSRSPRRWHSQPRQRSRGRSPRRGRTHSPQGRSERPSQRSCSPPLHKPWSNRGAPHNQAPPPPPPPPPRSTYQHQPRSFAYAREAQPRAPMGTQEQAYRSPASAAAHQAALEKQALRQEVEMQNVKLEGQVKLTNLLKGYVDEVLGAAKHVGNAALSLQSMVPSQGAPYGPAQALPPSYQPTASFASPPHLSHPQQPPLPGHPHPPYHVPTMQLPSTQPAYSGQPHGAASHWHSAQQQQQWPEQEGDSRR